MRILFLGLPGAGHYLSTLPLATAFRAAGHEVLMVNNGEAAQRITEAGLMAYDCCPGVNLWAQFMERAKGRFGRSLTSSTPLKHSPDFWGWFGEQMAEGALHAARAFGADLVVSTLEQGAGRLVATAMGCPVLEQSVRLAWGPADARAADTRADIAQYLEPTRQRLGVEGPLVSPMAYLDLRPPRLGGQASNENWLLQPVPYNGTKVLPSWVLERPKFPRVVLTLGSVVPIMGGLAGFAHAVRDLASMEIELVLALGDFDLSALGSLPDNVRPAGWMPLSALMPTTAAIVHHGGAATCLTPYFYGVPQLALPQGADQPQNAKVVADSGAGLALLPDAATPEAIVTATRRLLEEKSFRTTALEIQREMKAQPSPAQTVVRVEGELLAR